MVRMFSNATAFNVDIRNWKLNNTVLWSDNKYTDVDTRHKSYQMFYNPTNYKKPIIFDLYYDNPQNINIISAEYNVKDTGLEN